MKLYSILPRLSKLNLVWVRLGLATYVLSWICDLFVDLYIENWSLKSESLDLRIFFEINYSVKVFRIEISNLLMARAESIALYKKKQLPYAEYISKWKLLASSDFGKVHIILFRHNGVQASFSDTGMVAR